METQSTEHPLDARVARVAARQHGLVTRTQLREVGLGDTAITKRVKAGRLHRVHRGVFKVGYPALSRNGRFMAAVLAAGDGAALSHFSAAVLWGLVPDRTLPIHVTAEGKRRVENVVVHRAPLEGERVRREGIVVTTPGRTLVDLADVVPRRALERAADEAHYLRLELTGLTPRRGRNGTGLLTSVLAVHTAGSTCTRSDLEELFLTLCDSEGLPRPEVNVHIEGYECDFVWHDARLVVETDGGAAHATVRAQRRDPERDARLLQADWRVWRLPYVQVVREPNALVKSLAALLKQGPRPATPGARRRP
jgi:hypothetical protein